MSSSNSVLARKEELSLMLRRGVTHFRLWSQNGGPSPSVKLGLGRLPELFPDTMQPLP